MKRSPKNAGNSSTLPKHPATLPPSVVERHEGNEGGDFGGDVDKKTSETGHPRHWKANVKLLCSVLLVIITGLYTHYAYQQACAAIKSADAAKSAADTAARTLEMDRPYVSIDLVPIDNLEFTADGLGHLRLGSIVVNYGRNPALDSKIFVQFLSQAKGSPKSESDPLAFCKYLESSSQLSIESINGGTYYPNVPYKASWNVEGQGDPRSNKVFMAILVACVAYQSPFSKEWLYTGKVYTIEKKRLGRLGGTLLPSRGESVPQKDLVLAPYVIPEISH